VIAIRIERERQGQGHTAAAGGGSGARGGEVEVGGAPASTISDGHDMRDLSGAVYMEHHTVSASPSVSRELTATAIYDPSRDASADQYPDAQVVATTRSNAETDDMMMMELVRARVLKVREARAREEAELER
jgi:hypothetical protein